MNPHKLVTALTLSLIMLVLASACGGEEATPPPISTPSPAPTSIPTPTAIPAPATPAPTPLASVTAVLKALGDSGQSGEATLTSRGDQTEVVIAIKAGLPGVAQPAHIHDKDCTTPGAVKFPLTSVVDGKSTTTVNTSLKALQAGQFAIRVHKSPQEAAIYVACAEVPTSGTSTSAPPVSGASESSYSY